MIHFESPPPPFFVVVWAPRLAGLAVEFLLFALLAWLLLLLAPPFMSVLKFFDFDLLIRLMSVTKMSLTR